MNFETLFYFIFSTIALSSAIFVIYSTNTIYSAFFLILVFTSATGLLLISEVEFISIMLIIIYVGAITVLFLFVIMMLDINLLNNKKKNQNFGYLPIIFLISFTFFIETFLTFSKIFDSYQHFTTKHFILDSAAYGFETEMNHTGSYIVKETFISKDLFFNQFIEKIDSVTNVETIGQILYTYYAFFFLIAGIILVIALIGAVTLTKKEKKNSNFLTKNLYKQLSRNYLNAIFNAK